MGRPEGHRRRWPFVAVAVIVVVAVGAVLAYRRYHDDVRAVTIDEAIDEYGRSTTTTTPAVASTTAPGATVSTAVPASTTPTGVQRVLPAPGVYRYAATGSEGVDALTKPRHDYSGETAVIVTAEGCGVRITWTPFEERTEGWDMCLDGDGIVIPAYTSTHEFFGTRDSKRLTCPAGNWLIPPTATAPAAVTCSGDGLEETRALTVVGPATVDVDGRTVDAVEVTIDVQTGGSTVGTTRRHLVLDALSGLPLSWTDEVRNHTETPIGTVNYDEQFTLTLRSMTPAT